MSKIQEALRKLQSPSGPAERVVEVVRDESVLNLGEVSRDTEFHAPRGGSSLVVTVDRQALRDAGLIAPEYHERMLADEYRDIKRPLIANAFGKRVTRVQDGNLIFVSSAVSGDGKTFTSINLALSIAQERDLTALLIDADVAKPHISNVFGLAEMPGLLDILEDESVEPEACIVPTDIPGLSILPAGKPRSTATELLSSSRMEQFLQVLSQEYPRCVSVFDTPPLLETSEGKALASMTGQAVLTVKAESTSKSDVADALHVFGDDRPVNLVLNQSRMPHGRNQYGYQYSSQNSDPSARESDSKVRKESAESSTNIKEPTTIWDD